MKIAVLTRALEQKHKDKILSVASEIDAEVCFASSESEIPAEFLHPDVVYGFGMEIAKNNKDLKWLCVPSAGVDYLMKPGVFANEDCILTNSSGAYGVTIAEHIIAVTLMLMRDLPMHHSAQINHKWGYAIPQRSIIGSRITVLGTGDIGCEFARRARAFEPLSLIGVSRSGKCREDLFDRMYEIGRLDEVLPQSDLLVMCLPDTPMTRGILSRERIAKLPRGAFVVNVGRGSAIDEDALVDALEDDRLAGAALDVFSTEPLPEDSRLWDTKNLLITPHVAGDLMLPHTVDKNVDMFLEDLILFSSGKKMKHVIDKIKGY